MVRAKRNDDLPSALHLTEPPECQALVDSAMREYGRIDGCSTTPRWRTSLAQHHQRGWNRDLRKK